MTITLKSLSGRLVSSISFSSFSEVLSVCLENIPVSFCLTFYVGFFELGRTALLNLRGMVLCMAVPFVDCVCPVTFTG